MNMAVDAFKDCCDRSPIRFSGAVEMPGGRLTLVDGTAFSPEIVDLLRKADKGEILPNYDHLLFDERNAENWEKVLEDPKYYPSNESDVSRRASEAHARQVDPKQALGLLALACGTKLGEKEREVIKAHIDQGHTFSFIVYSDTSPEAVKVSMEQGKAMADEFGLRKVEHIPALGDIFSKQTHNEYKAKIKLLDRVDRVIATSFGHTFQNVDEPIRGIQDALDALTAKLTFLHGNLPANTLLMATYDQNRIRDSIQEAYSSEAHDAFTLGGIECHMGPEIADISERKRSFIGNTTILNRDVVINENMIVMLPTEGNGAEPVFFKKGKTIWHGLSAKFSENKIQESYVASGWKPAAVHPFRDGAGRIACHLALNS